MSSEPTNGTAATQRPEPPASATPPANPNTDTRVAKAQQPAFGQTGLQLRDLGDLFRFSQYVATSGLAPKGMERPETILVALELGAELGLPPMAALQNIAVINNRPGIFGDAALALVRTSGLLAEFAEWHEVAGKRLETPAGHVRPPTGTEVDDPTCTAFCSAFRKGDREPTLRTFAVTDAKRAGLWGKDSPWKTYPARMLMFRARGFALRDGFGDVLKGLRTMEELRDTPPEVNVTMEAVASPARPAPSTDGTEKPAKPRKARPEQPAAATPSEPTAPPANGSAPASEPAPEAQAEEHDPAPAAKKPLTPDEKLRAGAPRRGNAFMAQ